MKQRIVFDAIYERLEQLEYAEVTEFGHYPDSLVKITDRYFSSGLESVAVEEKSRALILIVLHFLKKTNNTEIIYDSIVEDVEYRAASDFINATKEGVKSILRNTPISLLMSKKPADMFNQSYSMLEILFENKLYEMWGYNSDDWLFSSEGCKWRTKISVGEKEEVDVNEQNMIWYEMMHEAIRIDIDADFYESSVDLYNKITTATYANWIQKDDVKKIIKTFEVLETTKSTAVQSYMISKKEYSENILDIWRMLEFPIVDIYEDALVILDDLLEPCICSDKKGREFVDERLLKKVFKIKYRREFKEIEFQIFKPVRDTFLSLFEDVKLTTVCEGVTDETRLIRERLRSLTENDKCQYDNLLEYYLT